MAFTDDVKKAEQEMNKAFGIVTLADYSVEEQNNYSRIQAELNSSNISIEEYRHNIDQQMSEVAENMRLQDKYFQELVENNEPKALEIQEKLSQKEKAYHDEKSVFNAKKESFEKNNQMYKELIAEHKLAEQKIAEKTKEMNSCLGEETEKAEQKEAKRIEDLNKKLEEQNQKKEAIAKELIDATKLEKSTNMAIQANKEAGLNESEMGDIYAIYDNAKKALDKVSKEANKIEKEIASLSKQLEDKSKFNAECEKIANKYARAQEDRMKLVEEEGKREIKILNAEANHNQLEQEYKEQSSIHDRLGTEYAYAREEARQYAGKVSKEKMESLAEEFKAANKVIKMKEQMSNDVPNRNSHTILKGADALNRAYQSYKSNHNIVARAFSFLPFLSAHSDYQKFSALRDKYMTFSGVKKDDINKYLDTNGKEKLGAIKTAYEDPNKDIQTEIINSKKQIEISNQELGENNKATEPMPITDEKVLEEDLSLYSNIADV